MPFVVTAVLRLLFVHIQQYTISIFRRVQYSSTGTRLLTQHKIQHVVNNIICQQ